jgi:hypothetical protein
MDFTIWTFADRSPSAGGSKVKMRGRQSAKRQRFACLLKWHKKKDRFGAGFANCNSVKNAIGDKASAWVSVSHRNESQGLVKCLLKTSEFEFL